MRIRTSLCLAPLLLAVVLGAVRADSASSAQTIVEGSLNSAPYSDAQAVVAVPSNTAVTILERQGGWYHVRLATGQDGWMPMTSLRLNSQSSGGGWGTSWFHLFESGRSGASGTTATTGVRGLNTGDIANAKPDPAAVNQVDKWQVKPPEARAFASQLDLKDEQVGYLPEVKQP